MARSTRPGGTRDALSRVVPGTPTRATPAGRTRLIINPVAGRDTAPDHLPDINDRLRSTLGDVDIVMTVGSGDAERAAHQAAVDGYGRVVVVGGDGTLNEALNGVNAAGRLDEMVFGIVPLGTGNDFASALGIADVAQATEVVLHG